MHILFWHNILSLHQSALTRALAERCAVTVVSTEAMTTDRQALGWRIPDFGRAQVILKPTDAQVVDLMHKDMHNAVHILGGARWSHLGDIATRECIRARTRMGFMAEPGDPRGLKGFFRHFKYIGDRFTNGRHIDFILAMGATGVCWYRECGYTASKVFPYAYLTEAPGALTTDASDEPSDAIDIVYLGQCIPRKGIDIALQALSKLRTAHWRFTIIGDGPSKFTFVQLAEHLGIKPHVRFLPAMRNDEALGHIAKADVFILPSRFDGWGAVVNEALMRGVPVLCSSRCGSADLLRAHWRGEVFPAGNVSSLRQVLEHWIAKGKRTPVERARLREWSRCITGEAAADYLLAILEHVYAGGARPEAPWCES